MIKGFWYSIMLGHVACVSESSAEGNREEQQQKPVKLVKVAKEKARPALSVSTTSSEL